MDHGNYGNNYSTTSYGAQGGAGGGGFMTGGSQNSPSGGEGRRGNESLRPVTIKQLNEAETQSRDDFKVDGAYISELTFIGQIRNISIQTTNITYKLDDGTGTMEVKLWIDSDADESTRPQVSENSYVRVWGRPKIFGNKRHVGAHFLRPIQDFNEISYHMLEATAVHLHYTRGPVNAKAGATNDAGAQNEMAMGGGMDGDLPAGLSGAARKIYNVLRVTPQSNEGLHVQDIAQRLQMEIAEVGRGGDELLECGVIYTTVDDQTWAILNTGGF